jgi:hypothetical protein
LDQQLSTIPQHQWVSKLFAFDFTIEFRPGYQNRVADALSRRDAHETVMALSIPHFELIDDIRAEGQRHPLLLSKNSKLSLRN